MPLFVNPKDAEKRVSSAPHGGFTPGWIARGVPLLLPLLRIAALLKRYSIW